MSRPTKYQVWMKLALILATRSTCKRLQVGTVITTPDLQQVLAVGYNGNYAGGPNSCDSETPGACGCIHSECNALIKCGRAMRDKIIFVTHMPCLACAKLIVNSGFSEVVYHTAYRLTEGIDLLRDTGIQIHQRNDV